METPSSPVLHRTLSGATAAATTEVQTKVRRFYNVIRELQAEARGTHTKSEIREMAEAAFAEALKDFNEAEGQALKALLEIDAAKEKDKAEEKARKAMNEAVRVRAEEVLREGQVSKEEEEVFEKKDFAREDGTASERDEGLNPELEQKGA